MNQLVQHQNNIFDHIQEDKKAPSNTQIKHSFWRATRSNTPSDVHPDQTLHLTCIHIKHSFWSASRSNTPSMTGIQIKHSYSVHPDQPLLLTCIQIKNTFGRAFRSNTPSDVIQIKHYLFLHASSSSTPSDVYRDRKLFMMCIQIKHSF